MYNGRYSLLYISCFVVDFVAIFDVIHFSTKLHDCCNGWEEGSFPGGQVVPHSKSTYANYVSQVPTTIHQQLKQPSTQIYHAKTRETKVKETMAFSHL